MIVVIAVWAHIKAIQIEGRRDCALESKTEGGVQCLDSVRSSGRVVWNVPKVALLAPFHPAPAWNGLIQGVGKMYLLSPSGSPGLSHNRSAETGSIVKDCLPKTISWCLADYDAVLTEAGDYTEKYFKLRKLFGSLVGTQQHF